MCVLTGVWTSCSRWVSVHADPDHTGGLWLPRTLLVSALVFPACTLLGHSQEWFYCDCSFPADLCFSGNAQDFCGADGILSWPLVFFTAMPALWGGEDGEGEVSSMPSSCPGASCLVQTPAGFLWLLLQSEWIALLSSEPVGLCSCDARMLAQNTAPSRYL